MQLKKIRLFQVKDDVLLILKLTFDRSIKRFSYSNHNIGTKHPKYIIDE